MTPNTARTIIDASELTLLVADHPGARAYQANPIDLSDPDEARETLAALRAEGEIVVVGIEFDDPDEPGNRVVLTGADLATARFVTAADDTIPTYEALDRLDRLDGLDHIAVTESE